MRPWLRWVLRVWFSVGAAVVVLVAPLAVVGAVYVTVAPLLHWGAGEAESAGLRSLIPGVTVPLGWGPVVLGALMVSVAVHEAGHALSGVIEGVKPQGWKLCPLPAVVFPSSLLCAPPSARLHVACAGVWHGLVLALLCNVAAPSTRAVLPFLGFERCERCLWVEGDLLPEGASVLRRVNGLVMEHEIDWSRILTLLAQGRGEGKELFCVPKGVVGPRATESPERPCCQPVYDGDDVCVEVVRTLHELPPADSTSPRGEPSLLCLRGRDLITHRFNGSCTQCLANGKVCVADAGSDGAVLVRLSLDSVGDVPLSGSPFGVFNAVKVCAFRSRGKWMPCGIADGLTFAFSVIGAVSLALSLANSIPARFLDGEWALAAWLECRPFHLSAPRAADISRQCAGAGTVLLAVCILRLLVSDILRG